jgi:hypothetical protein
VEVRSIELSVATPDEWRAPTPGVITFGRFDFHDISAKIRQRLANPGARENASDFQYA